MRGWCLEVHDLAIAKLVAGREKDLEFVRTLARRGYASKKVLAERLALTRLVGAMQATVEARLRALPEPDQGAVS